MTVAVIADIIGSRRLPDRAGAQQSIESSFARVHEDYPVAREPLRPVAGDEFQGVFDSVAHAVNTILLVRLALPEGLDCRFGLGLGEVAPVASSVRADAVPEGPGWWSARAAITTLHHKEETRSRSHGKLANARTWLVVADTEPVQVQHSAGMTNAYLLSRDELISAMTPRQRRLTYGSWQGRAQLELAEEEGIRQSAVSQALSTSGAAALLAGWLELEAGA